MNIANNAELKIKNKKIHSWEAELWSYLNDGDGIRCPVLGKCNGTRLYGECPDLHRKEMKRAVDSPSQDPQRFDFITNSNRHNISCRLFQLIERLAKKYIRLGNVTSPPLPDKILTLFDNKHTIEIREVKTKSLYSALWFENDKWIIQLRNSDSEVIKRYSLFHEGFHIIAHCHAAPIFKKIGLDNGSFNELLAGYFAGSILIPADWLIGKWNTTQNLDELAALFQVSKISIYIRLRQFGLLL